MICPFFICVYICKILIILIYKAACVSLTHSLCWVSPKGWTYVTKARTNWEGLIVAKRGTNGFKEWN